MINASGVQAGGAADDAINVFFQQQLRKIMNRPDL
jgi:hypothetical protein